LNPQIYPHVDVWLKALQSNELGMVLLLFVSGGIVVWLLNCKTMFPRLMQAMRVLLLISFYASFVLLIAGYKK